MMKFMQPKKVVFLWLPVVLWMGLIFYLSAQPGLKVAEGAWDFWTRKPAHMVEYVVLFLLLFQALKASFSWKRWEVYAGAGIISFLFSATDELHQLFVPLREGKLIDLGFDLLGIAAAILFLHLKRNSS